MEKSLTKQTFSGFLWLSGVKASNAILQFGILAILARLLTPNEFGLMGLALIVVSFSDIFTDIGFGPAITQKRDLCTIDIYTGFSFSIIFGIILVLILWIISPLIASFFSNEELIPILKAISFVLFLRSVTTVPLGIMYRNLEYKKLSLIQIVSYAIGYGAVGIILSLLGFGVWSLVIAVICQTLLLLILFVYFSKGRLGFAFNLNSLKSLLHFGGGYSLSKIFTYAGNKGDKIVVGRMLGVDALGLYERGYQITKFTSSLFGEIIDKVLFSPIAKKQDDRKLIGNVFLELTYILAVLFFPLSVFVYNNAKVLVFILLGEQWEGTVNIVKIMSITMFFLISTRIGATVAKSLGDVYTRALRSFIYAVIVITGAYFASHRGIDGVIIAITGAIVINYILAFTQVNKLTGVGIVRFIEVHFLGLILAGIYQVVFYLLNSIFPHIEVYSLLMQLLISLIILIGIYLLFYIFDYKRVTKKYLKLITRKS